jgi:hypothetical protein
VVWEISTWQNKQTTFLNSRINYNDKAFEKLVYEWFFIIFHKHLIDFAQSFIWSSLDNFKNISKYNYLISKPDYVTSFLITTSYPYNYLTPCLITIFYLYIYFTLFPYPPTWIWKDILTCVFSCPQYYY